MGRTSFNPTLVRLRRRFCEREGLIGWRSFNPTLVRLRRVKTPMTFIVPPKFQSHAGSIEAEPGSGVGSGVGVFQSHAGSIEAYSRQDPAMDGRFSFNPTLVRLRRSYLLFQWASSQWFQSHAGSIEAKASDVLALSDEAVSIPRWFD